MQQYQQYGKEAK